MSEERNSTICQERAPAMNKLRQSLRRKKQPYVPEASRPHQWQSDEESVRKGKCSFPVRYLGHMEVEESRGMHVCEEAVKKLKTELKKMKSVFQQAGKKSVKAILWVSADGLRVVDDKTKDLIVDQTIEKVSFCAPDRNYDKAFSYICRDGTTRRWICHCFMALKDSGERLSHAVGCAFAACLERKQKREKECGVTASFDASRTSFTREGSFRVTTASQQAEREETMKQLQDKKKGEPVAAGSPAVGSAAPAPGSTSPPQGAASPVDKSESNPQHAIPRRHAPLEQLVRQGSFRGFPALSQKNSPFKRQLSLRLNELPSTLQRKTAEFEVKSPVLELDSSPTNDPGSVDALCPQGNTTVHKPLMDPFSTTPASSLISANVPTLPPHAPQGVGGWADVASTTTTGGPTVVSSTFHPSHRRTPSEAERWLQEVAKAARAQQPLVSVPTGVPAFPVALDAPVSLFVPPPMQPAFVPVATYPPGLTNGAPFPPASVPVVGITPSQMVANAFGSAQAAHTHQAAGAKVPSFPPAFGHSSSSPASGPPRQPNGAAVPSQPGAGGVGRGAWLPDPTPPDADRFEAQWAALESKSQPRVGPLPTNPFTTDLQKTFEIQL